MNNPKIYQIKEFSPKVTIIPSKRILGRSKYRIDEDCTIIAGSEKHLIESGFVTDGATVPWLFRPIFPAVSKYFGATTIHDKYTKLAASSGRFVMQQYADNQFYGDMVLCGTTRTRARLMLWAVKLNSRYLLIRGVLK